MKGAWGEIAKCLPDRSLQACHNLIRRKFNPFNYKGKWTEDEEDELIDHVEKYGKEWKKVAELMGRTATNIRDKWRELGGDNYLERRRDEWSIEEIVHLLKLVEKSTNVHFLGSKLEAAIPQQLKSQAAYIMAKKGKTGETSFYFLREQGGLEQLKTFLDSLRKEGTRVPNEDINWTAIAEMMKTRSVDDCRNKWSKQLYLLLTSQRRYTGKDDRQLAEGYFLPDENR